MTCYLLSTQQPFLLPLLFLLNACFFLPLMLLKQNRINVDIVAQGKYIPSLKELLQIGLTFSLTTLAWIFFRSETISQALSYIGEIFSASLFTFPQVFPEIALLMILVLIITEWLQRDKQHALQFTNMNIPQFARWGIYYTLIFIMIWFGGNQQEFIYFQF